MQNRIVNKAITEFDGLKWNEENDMGTKQALVQFPNGYAASVVKGPYTYGGRDGLYELAVLDSRGNITYDTPITSDVVGYLSPDEVNELLVKIKNLPDAESKA